MTRFARRQSDAPVFFTSKPTMRRPFWEALSGVTVRLLKAKLVLGEAKTEWK